MASFDYTKVDPNKLSSASINIENSVGMMQKALTAIDEELKQMLLPTWQGPASTQFYTLYENDSGGFLQFISAVRECNEMLKQASGIFDNADTKAFSIVNELKIE